MIQQLHTAYIKDGYIFECKKDDMETYGIVGLMLLKNDVDYCVENLKNECNIYKVTQV